MFVVVVVGFLFFFEIKGGGEEGRGRVCKVYFMIMFEKVIFFILENK